MNVDWDWIKQRPHFLAEHLSKSYNVTIFYPFLWKRYKLTNNKRDSLTLIPYFKFPLEKKNVLIEHLNNFLLISFFKVFFIIKKLDLIWVTHPDQFKYLPKVGPKVYYDCMDDCLLISNVDVSITSNNEFELIRRSSKVFCSSQSLIETLKSRYGQANKYVLINNAFEGPPLRQKPHKNLDNEFISFCYLGTVSHWFDFDAVFFILNNFSNITITIIGPIENLDRYVPKHVRLIYKGQVSHSKIFGLVNESDALIMPFKNSELTKSVDPVKLYEYINFDKPIISVKYPEMEKFSDFVYFYENMRQLFDLISALMASEFGKKYTEKSREEFLLLNTWEERAKKIKSVLQ
jgi:teichuronic acid biosynthesis glycosyltransferase TuaH